MVYRLIRKVSQSSDEIEIERDEFHRLFDAFPHATISRPTGTHTEHNFEGYYGA